ncbi:MAG: hypothetical protein WCN95_12845 [bacterium]
MNKHLKEYSNTLRQTLLQWLWREWTALGVAGASPIEAHNVIDPEALLLFTGTMGRWDPRLFDEVMDWLATNGRLLNGPRLKRLIHESDGASGRVVAAISSVLPGKGQRLDWKIAPAASRPEEALFYGVDDSPLPDYGTRDPDFLAQGFRRGRMELRHYSKQPDPGRPACLWLTLRSLFGINCRAEIMLYLLTNASGYPSQIARNTGYTQRNIQNVMVDLAASGQLRTTRKGREVQYRLASPLWKELLLGAQEPPAWVLWPAVLRALEVVWLRVCDKKFKTLSESAQAGELFLLMQHIRPLLERADIAHLVTPERHGLGSDYCATFIRDMDTILKQTGIAE